MGRLIYSMITSLDGYTEAVEGDLGWGADDDEEVHTFIGDTFRHVGTYLYGRRMYETMVFWETAHDLPESIRLQETTSGFHTPAFLERGVDEAEVVAQAAEQGVTLAPLGRYCLSPVSQSGLVFGFGCAAPEDIARGMGILRELPALR